MQEFKRGGIFYVEKFSGGNTSGSIQPGGRPALIVSGDRFNRTSDILEVVYLTCNPRDDLPTHVTIRGASKESVAICEQISSVRKEWFIIYISTAAEDEMSCIDMALLLSTGINMNKIKAALAAAGPNWEAAYRAEKAKCKEMAVKFKMELIKAHSEADIYKELYAEMTELAIGRTSNA